MFIRSLDVCIFNCSFCLQISPSNLTLRFACFAGRFLRRLCSGLLLGLRSANEWKHGATRSAVASEHSYGGYARGYCSGLLLGLSLHCYRVPGIRWHNNRWLALWSRYNPAGLQLLFYGLILSLWEITLHCYSDYISIWIIQPAVRFDRRYDLTAESLYVSFFNCSFWR
jgi:hypothetical protein